MYVDGRSDEGRVKIGLESENKTKQRDIRIQKTVNV